MFLLFGALQLQLERVDPTHRSGKGNERVERNISGDRRRAQAGLDYKVCDALMLPYFYTLILFIKAKEYTWFVIPLRAIYLMPLSWDLPKTKLLAKMS